MSFEFHRSTVDITCEKCGEPVDARVTGFEADVEVGPDHDLRICETDKYGLNLHVEPAAEKRPSRARLSADCEENEEHNVK